MDTQEPLTSRQTISTASHKFDSGKRRPTIPTGIVTTRLGQLKRFTDDNGSVIRYNHGDRSRQGPGSRGKGGFVIPASRSSVFLHATPPRSQEQRDDSLGVDRLLTRSQTGRLEAMLGPRVCKSYDGLSSHQPAAAGDIPDQPFYKTAQPMLHDEDAAQPTIVECVRCWANGDGVLDEASGPHLCHSCGEWVSFDEPCASCGHAFCSRCTADIEEEDSNTSQVPTGTSETPSSPSPAQQSGNQANDQRNNETENYPWSSASPNPTTSMSSSSRSVPRAKTLSSLFLTRPARHCICCIARKPATRRQTVAALPGAPTQNSSSYSGSSTATQTTTMSNLRAPENVVAEDDLRPAALQPRRSTEAQKAMSVKSRPSDPFAGHRLMRPHPHEPSPEVESWPKLRQVPEPSSPRPDAADEQTPWGRNALRKVSKPATGEPAVYQKPTTKPEWVANLRKVRRQSTKLISPREDRMQPPTPNSPLDRSKQGRAYYDGNRSVSTRPGERLTSSNNDEQIPQCEHSRLLTKSPSLASRASRGSLKQADGSLPRIDLVSDTINPDGPEQRRQPDATALNRSRATTLPSTKNGRLPGIMKAPGRERPRDQHSCHWRDRFMDLSAEVDQLRSELDSCDPADSNSAQTDREHECDDAGIDGLTVVIHLKGRDDLVINTDLRIT